MSAKILADNLFPTQNNMIKIDCSELSQSIDVNKLIGSPAGYIGYEDGGILTNFVKNNPRCVILFDEIEKAHRSIYNLTLQMLNDGILTDSKGDRANFSNTIIIFTTNVGAENTQNKISFGNNIAQENNKIEKFFPPEFIGRLSCVANFKPLSEETVDKIIIKEIALKFKEFGILNKSPETYLSLIKNHLNLKLGVRNIQNAIEKYIILPIINKKK
jgi:ATP-dependent Clp protease ATP-binding subunit ClpB